MTLCPTLTSKRPTALPLRCLALIALWLGGGNRSWAQLTINGFNLDERVIPAVHVKRAAPEKDYIPALNEPKMITPEAVEWLHDEDEVISITLNGETRAYPLRILVWHEIVNDTIGGAPVLLTYSALTGSAVAFHPGLQADGQRRMFGGSGLLYNSGLLFYDREHEDLWSQLRFSGVTGEASDVPLEVIHTRRMEWAIWKRTFPAGKVLAPDTGYERDYAGEWPYGDYATDRGTLFPFDINRNEFNEKERVIGLRVGEYSRCWPLEKLRNLTGDLYDTLGTTQVTVRYDADTEEVVVSDMMTGKKLPVVSTYWFGWQAFYPDTSIWIPLD